MFSLFGKLISSVWHWNSSPVNQLESTNHIKHNIKNGQEKICCVKGKVTRMNRLESYGLVNQAIYFDFDTVCGNEEVSVGDIVVVQAVRSECHHAWKAESVYVCHNEWESGSFPEPNDNLPEVTSKSSEPNLSYDTEHFETIEGTVTECNDNFGRLDNNIFFLIKDGTVEFKPVVGDLFKAVVSYTKLGRKIINWEPKRTKYVTGIITAREIDCGIINDDIIFFFSSCSYDFTVSCGLKVTAIVVESKQEVFKWRAFSLTCLNKAPSNEITKECVFDKDGILIDNDLDFKCLDVGQNSSIEVTLKNNTAKEINFLGCQFGKKKKCQFTVCRADTSVLAPNSEVTITVSCKAEYIGQDSGLLLFEFDEYFIRRMATVIIVDPIQHMLNPTAPFSFLAKSKTQDILCENSIIIPGEKCFRRKITFSKGLPSYPIPRYLWRAIEEKAVITEACPYLLQDLTIDNYVNKFSCLLHLEEIQMTLDMKEFDMFEVTLQNRGEFLCLEVPRLAEGRPSLLIGDRVFLIHPSNSEFVYEGYIHEVHQNDILLKFNENFHGTYNGETFDVSFRFNRTNMRRLQQCVRHVKYNNRSTLFPLYKKPKDPMVQIFENFNEPSNCDSLKKSCKVVTWQNKKLNYRQKEAVQRILEGRCRPLSYIIFGPPGTGKTVTLVETVLQVLITFKNSRILVCTPSNSAADLVAQRLVESKIIDETEMVRLNSYQRSVDSIPEFIQPFCKDKNDLEAVIEFRIIISTCSTAGSLYTLELPPSHFTHIFIDEAGQLTEPECMIAVGLNTHKYGQVIMAGDPQQLGPVLRSSIVKTYGLEISYLERIMESSLYNRNGNFFAEFGGYDPSLVTMLVESYRSHPAILRFPSDTFYFSQIKCCIPEERLKSLCDWKVLPTDNFPIIFHGIKGEEFREENSPSWFNPTEVVQTVKYLQQLYEVGLSSEEVGIIAPYKKQVEKIRLLLSAFNLESCKIGSVEEFQGQERRAIIISTVRSCSDFVNYDVIHNLGFVSNPKRFNVAVTRAMEILIVVGNPHVLSKDFYWNAFIEYCNLNGAYIGCELPLSFSNLNDVA